MFNYNSNSIEASLTCIKELTEYKSSEQAQKEWQK